LLLTTLVEVLLVFEALPLVALPLVVLPETLAEPLAALWLFVLVTVVLLKLVTVNTLLTVWLTWLFEPGPVVLIEALLVSFTPNAAAITAALPLDDMTLVLVELLLLAAPLVAEPPVVLPETLAEPVAAPWPLALITPVVLVFNRVTRVVSVPVIWLFEPGPVVPIEPV
jgi:hypothetical protein